MRSSSGDRAGYRARRASRRRRATLRSPFRDRSPAPKRDPAIERHAADDRRFDFAAVDDRGLDVLGFLRESSGIGFELLGERRRYESSASSHLVIRRPPDFVDQIDDAVDQAVDDVRVDPRRRQQRLLREPGLDVLAIVVQPVGRRPGAIRRAAADGARARSSVSTSAAPVCAKSSRSISSETTRLTTRSMSGSSTTSTTSGKIGAGRAHRAPAVGAFGKPAHHGLGRSSSAASPRCSRASRNSARRRRRAACRCDPCCAG
jgi:hypothetical protein